MPLYKASTLKPNWRLCGQKPWCPGFKVHEPHFERNLNIPSLFRRQSFELVYKARLLLPGVQAFGNNSHNVQLTGNKHKMSPPRLSLLSFRRSPLCLMRREIPQGEKWRRGQPRKTVPGRALSGWSKGLIPTAAHLCSVAHLGAAARQGF